MLTRHFAMAALLCALLPVHAPATAKQELDPAVVLEWNQLAHATIPASAGPLGLRYYAIMHIAMFDAANSIQRQYTPFRASVSAASGASPEAAVAQAAHDVLVALIPGASQKAMFDAALNARLATLPPGRADQGVVVGRTVANRTLKWRANDGIFGPPIPYGLPPLPGMWQPAAPGGQPGLSQLPAAVPFSMKSITQFITPRHPELTSDRYATDFNEVKEIGLRTSATRTATQTQTAQLFAGVISSTNVFVIWNNVARDLTLSRGLSLLESARLFAFLNVSMMDSLLSTQTGKFTYGLWRPNTAIPNADDDLNAGDDRGSGLGTAIGHATVSDLPGQHGRPRCLRGRGTRHRDWHRRCRFLRDLGGYRPQPGRHAPVLEPLAVGPGRSRQPDLRWYPFPFRQRSQPAFVPEDRRARVRQLMVPR